MEQSPVVGPRPAASMESTAANVASSRRSAVVQHDDLLCSICFDILCFPVTLPCGHNFDRGCILTAWEYDTDAARQPQETEDANSDDEQPAKTHSCPLCRQPSGITKIEDVQVNLLLKDLISMLYPAETQGVATASKQKWVTRLPTRISADATAAPSRTTYRTTSSFIYFCLATLADPPGFVLAVLLLLGLVAIAYNPQPSLLNGSTNANLFEIMDQLFNTFALLVHEFSRQMDQLGQVLPWIHFLSYIL